MTHGRGARKGDERESLLVRLCAVLAMPESFQAYSDAAADLVAAAKAHFDAVRMGRVLARRLSLNNLPGDRVDGFDMQGNPVSCDVVSTKQYRVTRNGKANDYDRISDAQKALADCFPFRFKLWPSNRRN